MFDRFDICEAYYVAEMMWGRGGILLERPACGARQESIGVQLHRMGFSPRPSLGGPEDLTENGREIYESALFRWGLLVLREEP